MSAFQALGPFISTFSDPDLTGLYCDSDGKLRVRSSSAGSTSTTHYGDKMLDPTKPQNSDPTKPQNSDSTKPQNSDSDTPEQISETNTEAKEYVKKYMEIKACIKNTPASKFKYQR